MKTKTNWFLAIFTDTETEHKIAVIHRYNQMIQRHLQLGTYTYEKIMKKSTIHQKEKQL